MNAFDKIIGYKAIKDELLQICDMVHNKETYSALGAKLPNGVLIYGDPGLGKSLMAKCFIEQCGLPAYTVRKNKEKKEFVDEITNVFSKAAKNAPSVIFLDDMDKFANEDEDHCDAEEYVAVQTGIDEVKGLNVFVVATANDIYKLPRSLRRSGRFDRKIEVCTPEGDDAFEIIKHFLKDKKISDDINLEDVALMINYNSCAELETVINEAAIIAAYARKDKIEISDIVKAVLRTEYDSPDSFSEASDEEVRKIALHEAGHLVMCEVLCPSSVGLASLRIYNGSSTGGFVRRCKNLPFKTDDALVSLSGKAAVELTYGICPDGCTQDIQRAFESIRDYISENGSVGFGMVDVACRRFPETSESMNSRNESVVQAELERYMFKAKEILALNRDFLEAAASALIRKGTLLHSDITKLRESVCIKKPAV